MILTFNNKNIIIKNVFIFKLITLIMNYRKKLAIIFSIVFLFGCGEVEVEVPQAVELSEVSVYQVKMLPYDQEYKANADVKADQYTQVAAEKGGRIKKVEVKEGDMVKAGQVLLRYSTSGSVGEAGLAEKQAQENLASAERNLVTAESTSIAALSSAQNQVVLAEQNLDSTKNETELAIANAEKNLKSIQDNLGLGETQTNESALTTLQQAIPSVDDLLTFSDEILGVSDLNKNNNDYESNLKSVNYSLYNTTQNELRTLMQEMQSKWSKFEDLNLGVVDLIGTDDPNAGYEILKEAEQYIASVEKMMNNLDRIISDSVVNGSYSNTIKSSYKSSLATYKQGVYTARQQIQQSRHSVENNLLNVGSGQNASLVSAQSILESTINQANNQIKQMEINLQNAKNSENLTKAQQDAALTQSRNAVESAKIALANVRNNYYNQVELAPISGWISDLQVKNGDNIGSDKIFTDIIQTQVLKADFYVPVEISHYIKLNETNGQIICSSKKEFPVSVTNIDVIAGASSSVKIEVTLPEEASIDCKVGEIAPLQISFARDPQLLVPSSALVWQGGSPIVWLVDSENKLYFKFIEVDQFTGDFAVVKSGINVDEKIVENPMDQFRNGQEITILSQKTENLSEEVNLEELNSKVDSTLKNTEESL